MGLVIFRVQLIPKPAETLNFYSVLVILLKRSYKAE